MGTLVLLCGMLAVLQYRWIGEVSIAEKERLRSSLGAMLFRLSNDFNTRVTSACRALLPSEGESDPAMLETQILLRRAERSDRSRMIRRIGIVEHHEDVLTLRTLDAEHTAFYSAEWPAEWRRAKERLELRSSPERWRERRPPGPPGAEDDLVFELPLFRGPGAGFRGPGGPPQPASPPVFVRPEMRWLIIELDATYLRDTLLPELLQHYLGNGSGLDYQVEVVTRTPNPRIIYRSDPQTEQRIATAADGSVGLLELRYEQLIRRFFPQPGREPTGVGRGPGPDTGRWQLFVRHRAGSLEAVVTHARRRNLTVTAGIFLLMAASIGALVRFTRNAQRLAELQMEFVAGVSHELRTPLTAIYTAGYNLQGRVANNPVQVTKYGAMIQQESGRLKAMVEQVLRFASAESGRVKQASEPVSAPDLIAEALEANQTVIQRWQCVVEQHIQPGLPLILGDAVALKHAIGNLLSNAARYGSGEARWIGISAGVSPKRPSVVEIRVADRGPGIPREEQGRVFDAYFRGRRALEDQVQGTGLGLNLVKRIVEAHGGEVTLKSEPAQGAEFILRLPAAPQEQIDEFAHSAGRG